MSFVWRKIRYDIRNMTSRHTIPDFSPILEKNPVGTGEKSGIFGEKSGMVGRCDFVAFRVDLRLQSPIIIIFRNGACVRTTKQSRTVEYTRLDFWTKIRYFWRKIRYFWRKIRYEIQFGEKSGTFGEKSGENGEKFGIDTDAPDAAGMEEAISKFVEGLEAQEHSGFDDMLYTWYILI
jgi:hypothetical protein